jgi:hypothetical protein
MHRPVSGVSPIQVKSVVYVITENRETGVCMSLCVCAPLVDKHAWHVHVMHA